MDYQLLVETLSIVSATQALIFGIIFLFRSKQNKALFYLGLFLLVFSGTSFQWYFNKVLPPFTLLVCTFSYAILPMFWVYVSAVLGKMRALTFLPLIPAGIELLVNVYFTFDTQTAQSVYNPNAGWITILLLILLPPLYNILFAVRIIFLVKRNKKEVYNYFTQAEVEQLNWISLTAILLLLDYTYELLSSIGMLVGDADWLFYILQALLGGFVVYWVSIRGLTQQIVVPATNSMESLSTETTDKESYTNTSAHVTLSPQSDQLQAQIDYDRLVNFFVETKVYTQTDVSLFKVADLLQMNYKYLSKVINSIGQSNFNQFVNRFRIEEAQQILKDPHKQYLNLNGVAKEVGFHSRSVFFTAFKNITGQTPSEFKSSLNINKLE